MIDIPTLDQASGTARKTSQPTPIDTTRAAELNGAMRRVLDLQTAGDTEDDGDHAHANPGAMTMG
jgi:hypothetical protein